MIELREQNAYKMKDELAADFNDVLAFCGELGISAHQVQDRQHRQKMLDNHLYMRISKKEHCDITEQYSPTEKRKGY